MSARTSHRDGGRSTSATGRPTAAISRAVAFSLALAWAFVSLLAPTRAAGRTLKLGADLPLSGIEGESAIPARNGIVLAVETENRRGFPGGVTVALDDRDDSVQGKHDPAQGAQNVREFAADDDVFAVVGPMNSSVAAAEIPLAHAAGLALVSVAASATALTAPNARAAGSPTFFRVCASDDRAGTAAARFARRDLHVARAAVVDDGESYGTGIADVFAAEFAREGGRIVARERVDGASPDDRALLTKIASERPDALFFGGLVGTGGAIVRRQMADAGLGALPYLGGDGLASPQFVPLAGPGADGTYYTQLAPDVDRLPAARAFRASYRARFGSDPGTFGAAGFAAARVALEALRRSLARGVPLGAPDRGEIVRLIASGRLAVTPIGPISFDARGDLRDPSVEIYRISGGRPRFVRISDARRRISGRPLR